MIFSRGIEWNEKRDTFFLSFFSVKDLKKYSKLEVEVFGECTHPLPEEGEEKLIKDRRKYLNFYPLFCPMYI